MEDQTQKTVTSNSKAKQYKGDLPEPQKVLMFNARHTLVALFSSQSEAAKATGISSQAVHFACSGRNISSGGYYFRNYNPAFVIDHTDFGVMTVEKYDEACGYTRRLYSNTTMERKGMKYDTKKRKAARAKREARAARLAERQAANVN